MNAKLHVGMKVDAQDFNGVTREDWFPLINMCTSEAIQDKSCVQQWTMFVNIELSLRYAFFTSVDETPYIIYITGMNKLGVISILNDLAVRESISEVISIYGELDEAQH